ncbi:hypothetical protein CDL15_Pgr021979 [Punica granatum]|uniref:Uncharacterized protein n=1 Tax=Punica granatum TaxID=22663 RepID=A0A218WRX7_PUNGR|nr:hypothetical protein CDL15_Pgr021979 [Punica granatum]
MDVATMVPDHPDSPSYTYLHSQSRELHPSGYERELRAIKEERDRLRCELVDSRTEVADYKELQMELARARARVAHLDREMARLSAKLDRVRARAREISHP